MYLLLYGGKCHSYTRERDILVGNYMGKSTVAGFIFFLIGIITMALAGDAHGVVFFTGVLLLLIGIVIWIVSAVWHVSGVAEEKTREWLND